MAEPQRRGKRWRIEIYVRGKRKSKTFPTKAEANAWAAAEQTRLRDQKEGDIPPYPFRDLLDRYAREVSAKKLGGNREKVAIARLSKDPIADVLLPDLAPKHFARWRDQRLATVSGATVDREMTIFSHACTVARREWGWLHKNPLEDVRRPPPNPARTRRPTDEEIEAVLYGLGYNRDEPPETKSARIGAAYLFAIETAMRVGEICRLRWVDVNDRYVHLPKTKNGYARDIPLSKEAKRIIAQMRPVNGEKETVFELSTAIVDALFRKNTKRLMIEDLHFHDSRREALTRLSKIFSVMELAKISGHRDVRILQNVYYSPKVDDLADRLDPEPE